MKTTGLTKIKPWEIDNSFPVDVLTEGLEQDGDDAKQDEDVSMDDVEKLDEAKDANAADESDGNDENATRVKDWSKLHQRNRTPDPPGAFQNALELFNFKGLFVNGERYSMSRAANPCLEIDGVGPVGLPLGPRVAGELVGDGVELMVDASKIRFQNSGWETWLEQEMRMVCTELAGKKVRPLYRLRNLVLESSDSKFSQPKPSTNAIGSLVIFLPSSFTGGHLGCSLGVQSKVIDFAPESHIQTSVLAAYSDVEVVWHPVTSGYRFSLVYDILQSPTDPKSIPRFPDVDDAALALEQAVQEWEEDESDEPEIVAYFLQRQYPTRNFTPRFLTGSDAILMAHLKRIAEVHDFQIYLVQLELYQSKYGEYDPEGHTNKVDPRKISGLEIESELTALDVHAVDMEGVPVELSGFDFKGDDYLNGEIDDAQPHCEYDLFVEDRIRVDEKYNRTLFLLWRTTGELDRPVQVTYSHEYAAWALQASTSTTPSARETILVDSIRSDRKKTATKDKSKSEDLSGYIQALCKCACQWSDLDMLLKALDTHDIAANLGLMGVDNCVAAYRAFGWNDLLSFYEDAARRDVSNPRRHELAVRLAVAAKEAGDTAVEAWSATQQETVPRTLNPASIPEVEWLLAFGTTHGAAFLRDTIYPQLEEQRLEPAFWIPFVRKLQEKPFSGELACSFAEGCVLQAVENLRPFPTWLGVDWYGRPEEQPAPNLIMEVLKLCEDTDNIDLCVRILERMKQAAQDGISLAIPPWKYYLELTRLLDAHIPPIGNSENVYDFRPFFREAVLNILSGKSKGTQSFPCPFTPENLATLVTALNRAGGLSFLQISNQAALLTGRDSESLKTLIRHFVAHWECPTDASSVKSERIALLNAVVRQSINVFDTKRFHTLESTKESVDDMVGMLKFCFEVGADNEIQHLLVQFVTPPLGISVPQHVSRILAPFLTALRDYLATRALDLETRPFAKCSASIVKAFAATVMLQTPREVITDTEAAQLVCAKACRDCERVRDFIVRDDREISLPMAARAREHIIKQLAAPIPKRWGITFGVEKTNSGPHRLEIVKPDNMTSAGLWAENSQRGKALLTLLGDEQAQRRILGSDYDKVLVQICERRIQSKRSADEEVDVDSPTKKTKF
ncbi:hypothetical protein B0H16DRAFT_1776060 [Mycena metata]|uniref:Uncharacterized protein n=1 Tax=Mycena metata TaxID=1033252 RepID=A0AAD7MSZ9_9AGAR|nr:hypothetical protein B0H16DRAFT_1776060 [Mycena metata]